MVDKKPLLSICIPTYNREKYLKECIDSIVNQDWFNEKEIEIIISDNASTDNTEEVVQSFITKYKNIYYYKNKVNLWMVKNITMIVEYSKWKYSWILSDDDLLCNNILNIIINNLTKQLNKIYILNYSSFDTKTNKKISKNIMKLKKNINLKNEKSFSDFIIKNWNNVDTWILHFISNKIFLKEIFHWKTIKHEILNSKIKYEYKYAFPFTMILINDLINTWCFIISNDIIKARIWNISWNYTNVLSYKYYLYKYIYINSNYKKFKFFIITIYVKVFFHYYIIFILKKILDIKFIKKIII